MRSRTAPAAWALAAALLAAAHPGCYRPSIPRCAYRCGPAGECPADLSCSTVDGFCHASSDVGSCAGDGAPRPDGAVDPRDGGGGDAAPGVDGAPPSDPYVDLAVAATSACAVGQDKALWCWGRNEGGQLGRDPAILRRSARAIRVDGESNWAKVAVGSYHACGIREDQSLWCWGDNGSGQLGLGTPGPSAVYAPEAVDAGPWLRITAGTSHTCGIQTDGSLWCWGNNWAGQLGDGSTVLKVEPVALGLPPGVVEGTPWTQVSAGADHTCGIVASTLYCWGSNEGGKLGIGQVGGDPVPEPTQVTQGIAWVAVSAASSHTCGRDDGGQAYCWGSNGFGQISPADVYSFGSPQAMGGASLAIYAGGQDTCTVLESSEVVCRGANGGGQISASSSVAVVFEVEVPDLRGARAIGIGHDFLCARLVDDRVVCRGLDGDGQLGDGAGADEWRPVEVRATTGTTWRQVAAGREHVCALTTGDEAFCWGRNDSWQLGADGANARPTPVAVSAPPTGNVAWAEIGAGAWHSCGLSAGGDLWCWGAPGPARGDTGGDPSAVPVLVDSATGLTRLSVGARGNCAYGPVLPRTCWGENSAGELGTGNTSPVNAPMAIGSVTCASGSQGGVHGCGINADATLWCWGNNESGQLGVPSTSTPITTPVQVTGGATDWTFVSASVDYRHTCGLQGPSLFCWGENYAGQTGGLEGASHEPTLIEGDFSAVAAGGQHTCALDTGGKILCWGRNRHGQLGDGTATAGTASNPAVHDGPWVRVTAGAEFTCGIKLVDSSLWCWGQNLWGALGNGAIGRRAAAVGVVRMGTE